MRLRMSRWMFAAIAVATTLRLLSLTAPTRAEPGNIAYDLYQSTTRKSEFMRFEVWRNPEALEAHKMTPHLKTSFERRKSKGWTTEITLWKRVEP